MEKTIYIPGDLVMTNGIPIGTKKGIVYQVTESNADKYAKVEYGDVITELKGSVTLSNIKGKTVHDEGFLFADCGAWVKDIVPIPLTSDILENNGWKLTTNLDQANLRVFTYKKNSLCIEKTFYTGKFLFICNDQGIRLEYVSDLQHILFGFKQNSEMEV